MKIVRWSPFMEPFWSDMDKMFDDYKKGSQAGFSPALDIYEKDNNLIVETALPGIDAEKIEISVEDDVLTIQGKTEKKTEVDDKNYYRKEMHQGSFYRSVALPANVQGDKAKAAYDDGVLKIAIPKKEKPEAKKVKVEIKKQDK